MTDLIWHTEKRKIKNLTPFEKNPRSLPEAQAQKLKKSLKKFNLVEIPAIDTHNKILAGHQRMKIMLLLGRGDEEIDVRAPNRKLTKKEFEEYNLRSNINSADWDLDLLKNIDTEILLYIGMDEAILSNIWDENLSAENDEFNVDDEIKKIKTPVTKPGDFFKLGNHYLLCNSSTEIANVERLCNGEKISVIYCDPPFNISLNYNTGIGTQGKYGGKTNDNKSDEDYRGFLKKTIENAIAVSKPDFHCFYYCDESYIWLLQSLYRELGIDNKRVCLWIKNAQNPTPQVAFNKCYEAIVYGVRGTPYLSPGVTNLNEIFNRETTTVNRLPDDILDLFNIWLVKRLPSQKYTHPTEKPPSLHEKALRRCSKPGEAVLDYLQNYLSNERLEGFPSTSFTLSATEMLRVNFSSLTDTSSISGAVLSLPKCAPGGIRTPNHSFRRRVLCPLSYRRFTW